MNRITELHTIIQTARKELHELEEKQEIEENSLLVGKCFACWIDNGHDETIYSKITGIDNYGRLLGDMFKVHKFGTKLPYDITFYIGEQIIDNQYCDVEYEIHPDKYLHKYIECKSYI